MSKIKIATIQSRVLRNKYDNISHMAELVGSIFGATSETATFSGADIPAAGCGGEETGRPDIIVLPEMWNCPYKAKLFPVFAEPEQDDSWIAMSTMARKNHVYVVGGSIPELDNGKVYNTCYVFNRDGEQIAKHRKVHLFDVNFGEKPFHESDTLTGGDSFDVFETEWGKMAVNICFDVRFPEGMRKQAVNGAKVVFVPAAFMMKTGAAHWDMNMRMRAVENQLFLVADAPMRDTAIGYESWAHSMVINPWGTVLTDMGIDEGIAITEIDLDMIDKVRAELPLMSARRTDVY